MLAPRWRKVLGDLWSNKARTALVVFSIALGVFAIGMAISGYGLGKGRFGRSAFDRLLEKIRFLSRPLLLSLRNTFRRKGRLALTLTTLTLAGLIFMAVLSEQATWPGLTLEM